MTEAAQKLEALLSVAGEAVSRRELRELLAVSALELEQLLTEVQGALTGHGLTLVITTHDVELTTSSAVAVWLSQYLQTTQQEELTPAAVETLAIVAYCGPVGRGEVDVIRGVDSRRTLRTLRERGLVLRQSGQGRAPRYEVSEDFLKHLGLSAREQLPNFAELSNREKFSQLWQPPV